MNIAKDVIKSKAILMIWLREYHSTENRDDFYSINLSSLDIRPLFMFAIKKNYIKYNCDEIYYYHFPNF
jgi:hypothetical protein